MHIQGECNLNASGRVDRLVLSAILIIFVVLAFIYNLVTPLFEGPDEAAHFQYVKYMADGNGLPALHKSPRDVLWEGLQQPPLYYALGAALTFWIDTGDLPDLLWENPHRGGETGGINLYYHTDREAFPYRGTTLAVRIVRLLSTAFGALTVLATYLAARALFAGHRLFALGAAALVAFNPQFLSTSSTVGNDTAVAAFCSLGTWLSLRAARQRRLTVKDALLLSAIVALAAATKPSGLAFLLPAALTVALVARATRSSWRTLLAGWGMIGVLVLSLAGWWYIRNLILYGDPLGFNAMVAIDAETIRAEPLPLSEALYYSTWLQKSFWGVFGNGVLMDFSVYRTLEIAMRLSLLGLFAWALRQLHRRGVEKAVGEGLGVLILWSGLVYLALLRFMMNIDATNQGRLLFPAISALSILLLLGWTGLFPRRLAALPAAVASAGLLVLAVLAPFRYIAPAYAHPPAGQLASNGPRQPGVPVRFADKIELLDYTISPMEIKPGSVLHLSFEWRALAPMDTSYKLFVHVLGYDGELLTQLDTIPYRGRFATVLWKPGHEFRDEYDLFITGKAAPSLGRIQVGFYPWNDPGARLPVYHSDGQPLGDHFELRPFKIAPKRNEQPEIPRSVDARFGDHITLLGYTAPSAVRVGEPLPLTLYWSADAPVAEDYMVFIHLLKPDGEIVVQQDVPPQRGNYPTSIWGPEEIVTDEHVLQIPADLAADRYALAVGLYLPQTGVRLPLTLDGRPVPEGRALIGEIAVRP